MYNPPNGSTSSSAAGGTYTPNQQQQQQHQQLVNSQQKGNFWPNMQIGGGMAQPHGQPNGNPLLTAALMHNQQQQQQQQAVHQMVRGVVPTAGVPMKRSLPMEEAADGNNKENQQPNAKRRFQPNDGHGTNNNTNGNETDDDEDEDEEEEEVVKEEEEEEEQSRTTKSSSSAENEEGENTSSLLHHPQPQHQPTTSLMMTPHQYRVNQQPPPLIGNPLAHSTPYLGGLSLNSFQQNCPSLDYWVSSQLALVAANSNKSCGIVGNNPQLASSLGQQQQQHSATTTTTSSTAANAIDYYSNPYLMQQQQQHTPINYGGGAVGGALSIRTQQGYPSFLQQQHHNSSTFGSAYQSRDSGVGSVKVEIKDDGKNESVSSTSGSDESANSGTTGRGGVGGGSVELVVTETKFPPFIHTVTLNGQQYVRDLETFNFGMVPPRLALLNCNKKYSISLAEIYRRLDRPEHLNTSYLSGILRKAKNTNAGRELRDRLNSFGCGIDLRTGRRKQSSVTTFTTLCEREAIQMAEDFTKLAYESFPHQQVAVELNKRAVSSSDQARKRLIEVQNTSQILRELIGIMQQGIEQETLPFPSQAAALMAPPTDQNALLTTTLNGIKHFARLSHCFGNRTVLVAWQTLLKVFQSCEQSLIEGTPGTSYDPNQLLLLQNP